MNRRIIRITSLTVFLIVITFFSRAQRTQKYELGIHAGSYIYMGDLTPSALGSYRNMLWGFGFNGARIVNSSFALRANLVIAGLKGDESKYARPEYRQQRNFNFRTPLIELTAQLIWNPLGRNYNDKGFTPYLVGGGGFSYLNIKRDWSNLNAEYFGATSETVTGLAEDQQHRLPGLNPVIPAGVGLRYNISRRFAATAETSYRFVFTDYLDGFSKAANPERQDHFHSHTVGLVYRIGKKDLLDCPPVKK